METTARPAIADARDKAGAGVADAQAKAAPAGRDARDGRPRSRRRRRPRRAQAKEAADAKVATLRGEEPPKKGGKLKKFALFAAVAGAVGFVAKKLQGGKQRQLAVVLRPEARARHLPRRRPAPVEDAGGSAPDEAIADAAEEPHPVTTPDEPADVVDIADAGATGAKKAAKKP